MFVAVAVWLIGQTELTATIGVEISPSLSAAWFQQQVFWGSVFGLGFPIVSRRGFTKVRTGLILSLVPTTLDLLYLYGMTGVPPDLIGLQGGGLTPLFVICKNGLWGFVVARVMSYLVG